MHPQQLDQNTVVPHTYLMHQNTIAAVSRNSCETLCSILIQYWDWCCYSHASNNTDLPVLLSSSVYTSSIGGTKVQPRILTLTVHYLGYHAVRPCQWCCHCSKRCRSCKSVVAKQTVSQSQCGPGSVAWNKAREQGQCDLVAIRAFGVMYVHTLFCSCRSPDQALSTCQPGDCRWSPGLGLWLKLGSHACSPKTEKRGGNLAIDLWKIGLLFAGHLSEIIKGYFLLALKGESSWPWTMLTLL